MFLFAQFWSVVSRATEASRGRLCGCARTIVFHGLRVFTLWTMPVCPPVGVTGLFILQQKPVELLVCASEQYLWQHIEPLNSGTLMSHYSCYAQRINSCYPRVRTEHFISHREELTFHRVKWFEFQVDILFLLAFWLPSDLFWFRVLTHGQNGLFSHYLTHVKKQIGHTHHRDLVLVRVIGFPFLWLFPAGPCTYQGLLTERILGVPLVMFFMFDCEYTHLHTQRTHYTKWWFMVFIDLTWWCF